MEPEVKDRLGNVLAVGDTVAYSGASRWACPVHTGKVVKVGNASVSIKADGTTSTVWRAGQYVVKAATPA